MAGWYRNFLEAIVRPSRRSISNTMRVFRSFDFLSTNTMPMRCYLQLLWKFVVTFDAYNFAARWVSSNVAKHFKKISFLSFKPLMLTSFIEK